MPATKSAGHKSAIITLNTDKQNHDSLHGLVDWILKKAGCAACGRLRELRLDFLTDPPDDLAKLGATSATLENFS